MTLPPQRPPGAEQQNPKRASQNLAGGLFLMAIAALALYLAQDLPQGSLRSMGPAMLPDWLAYAVGACGLALVVSGLAGRGPELERSTLRGPLVVMLAIMAFAVTIRPFSFGAISIPGLGMVVAGPLAIVIAGYATREVQPRPLLILAFSLTAFCMILFGDLLNLPIPVFPQAFADLFPPTWSHKAILRAAAGGFALVALALLLTRRRRPSNGNDVAGQSGSIR